MVPSAESLANGKKSLNPEKLYICVVWEDHQLDGRAMLPTFLFFRGEVSAAICPTSNKQNPGQYVWAETEEAPEILGSYRG